MFEAENIRDWLEHDVVDADGHKIGELEAIYVDTGTDLPSFGTVKVGMVGRHRLVFVPLDRATVGPGRPWFATHAQIAALASELSGGPASAHRPRPARTSGHSA